MPEPYDPRLVRDLDGAAPGAPTAGEPSLGELFRRLSTDTSELVRQEMLLAKAEVRRTGATLARDGARMGVAIALASGLGLRSEAPADPLRRFLVEAGALTVVVTLDDALLVHETVGPHATGLPEEAVFGLYGVAAAVVVATAVAVGTTTARSGATTAAAVEAAAVAVAGRAVAAAPRARMIWTTRFRSDGRTSAAARPRTAAGMRPDCINFTQLGLKAYICNRPLTTWP